MAIVKNDIVNGFNNTVANGAKGTVVWNSSNKPANAPAEHFSNSVPTMAVSNIGGTMIQASTTINAIRNAIYNLSKIRKYEYIVNNYGNRGSGITTTVNQGNLADGYRQSAVNSNTNNFGIKQGNLIKTIDWNSVYNVWNSYCGNKISYTYSYHTNHGNSRSRR